MTSHEPLRQRGLSWKRLPEKVRAFGPWTVILFITAGFQFYRGAPVDGGVFVAVAVLLLLDALGWIRVAELVALRPGKALVIAAAVIAGLLLVITPRHGIVDGLVLIAIGLTVFPMVWPKPPDRPQSPETALDERRRFTLPLRRAAMIWAGVAVFGCLWEVTAFLFGLQSAAAVKAHPSVSELLDPILDPMLGRAVFVVVWVLIGLALLNRGRK